MKPIFLPLLAFISLLLPACSGQLAPSLPKVLEPPKLLKTQGTDVYAQVRCAIEDQKGNLWFGTSGEGLYRYDGSRFVQFTKKEGLSTNKIESVLEDANGTIWIGTNAGLCRFDGEKIIEVAIDAKASNRLFPITAIQEAKHAKPVILSMLQDKNGLLWLGTNEGVYCYNGKGFTRFLDDGSVQNPHALTLKETQYMLEDKAGNIWFGCGKWDGEGLSCYNGTAVTNFKPNGSAWIRYLVEDKKGLIWFGSRHDGNWYYDGKEFVKYTQKEGIGAPMLVDKAGNIWFGGGEHENAYGGDGGVWCYNGSTFKKFSPQDGMGDYSVWCMLEDKAGNIWFGTRNVGLYRYDGKGFTCFSE